MRSLERLKFGDDEGVVRRPLPKPGFAIDPGRFRYFNQAPCGPNMIYPPPQAPLNCIGDAIVPEGKRFFCWPVQAVNICKSPIHYLP